MSRLWGTEVRVWAACCEWSSLYSFSATTSLLCRQQRQKVTPAQTFASMTHLHVNLVSYPPAWKPFRHYGQSCVHFFASSATKTLDF